MNIYQFIILGDDFKFSASSGRALKKSDDEEHPRVRGERSGPRVTDASGLRPGLHLSLPNVAKFANVCLFFNFERGTIFRWFA